VLLAILLSASYGLFVGAIPGLTATMAVALMVPLTFFLDDITGLAAIVTMEACSIFAGDIPTTLLRIPGTPSSAAYTDDAYALTRSGLHQRALGVSLAFSVAGGLIGALVLIVAAPQLARFAFNFSSYEYFWLFLLGLSCAAVVSRESKTKGFLALTIGLLLSMVGLGDVHAVPRLTFGSDQLITGVNFIPAMIGMFGVSEVLRNSLHLGHPSASVVSDTGSRATVFGGVGRRLWEGVPNILRSSTIGSIVGMLPGAGADIAAWISYAVSKRFSRDPGQYGNGSLQGIADATTANNSSLAGAWIPALVLGIPGDSVTAIVIGVLLMKNIKPGPDIFTDPRQAPLVYGIYITFILANLLLIPLGYLAIRVGGILVRIPTRILLPVILLFCIVGSFAINGSYFDVGVMLAMGLLGFVLDRFRVPLGPVVLGIILGPPLEEAFVQNLTKSASLLAFFERPVAAGLGVLCLVVWLAPVVTWLAGFGRRTSSPQ
jgi:TctA family transporter